MQIRSQPTGRYVHWSSESDTRLEFWTSVVHTIEIIYSVIVIWFFLYLLVKFSAEIKDNVHDNVLKRKVPPFVFIRNNQLYKEAYSNLLTQTED